MKNAFSVFFQLAHLFQTGSTDTLSVAFAFEGRNYNLTAQGELGGQPEGSVVLDRSHGFAIVFQLIELLAKAIFDGSAAITFTYAIGDSGFFSLPITVKAI